jgi:hypothetical protein
MNAFSWWGGANARSHFARRVVRPAAYPAGGGVKVMVRRLLLLLAALLATGILASGCYESRQHVLEVAEYVDVILLDDDGLGTVGDIK